jgi:hypothetical protein
MSATQHFVDSLPESFRISPIVIELMNPEFTTFLISKATVITALLIPGRLSCRNCSCTSWNATGGCATIGSDERSLKPRASRLAARHSASSGSLTVPLLLLFGCDQLVADAEPFSGLE